MKKIIDWLKTSNHWKHLCGGFVLGVLLTVLCALGCAGGMEYKDKAWGGRWDWVDFALTVAGGLLGQAVQVLVIYLIIA